LTGGLACCDLFGSSRIRPASHKETVKDRQERMEQ
jgi:hypothetical protein